MKKTFGESASGSDYSGLEKTLERQKLKLLEEENKRLKKELDDCYEAAYEKEAIIQTNKHEVLSQATNF